MTFDPKFIKVDTVVECADYINKPHEDYPMRINATAKMIQYHIDMEVKFITDYMYKGIHSYIMSDLPAYQRGAWRDTYVTIGYDQPCPPFMIQGEIEEHGLNIIRFEGMDESDIIRWYRQFEIVHPFIDGNGRVGGVIAAIASNYLSKGEWLLAPCQ